MQKIATESVEKNEKVTDLTTCIFWLPYLARKHFVNWNKDFAPWFCSLSVT